jgi:hypothetical protein
MKVKIQSLEMQCHWNIVTPLFCVFSVAVLRF